MKESTEYISLGIPHLDEMFNGGAPTGSVVLATGESGSGHREAVYTTALIHGLRQTDSELFSMLYEDMDDDVVEPHEVHYISLTRSERDMKRELYHTFGEEWVDEAIDGIEFKSFHEQLFSLSISPESWYQDDDVDGFGWQPTGDSDPVHSEEDYRILIQKLGDYLEDHEQGNVVILDSLTDLIIGLNKHLEWQDISLLLMTLRHQFSQWNGLFITLVDKETLHDTELGMLMSAVDGTMEFEWESIGSQMHRVLRIREFREVLSRVEKRDIMKFDISIAENGVEVEDVKEIL